MKHARYGKSAASLFCELYNYQVAPIDAGDRFLGSLGVLAETWRKRAPCNLYLWLATTQPTCRTQICRKKCRFSNAAIVRLLILAVRYAWLADWLVASLTNFFCIAVADRWQVCGRPERENLRHTEPQVPIPQVFVVHLLLSNSTV